MDEAAQLVDAMTASSSLARSDVLPPHSHATLHPTRPNLPALPMALPCDLQLDSLAKEHLRQYCEQACGYAGLDEDIWPELFAVVLSDIDQFLTPKILAALNVTRRVIREAKKLSPPAEPLKRQKTRESEESEDSGSTQHSHDLLMRMHKQAKALLREGETPKGKLTRTSYRFTVIANDDPRRCYFLSDAESYDSNRLFDEDDHVVYDEKDWTRVGGTVELSCRVGEGAKLEKVLPVLVYAVLHLKLEAHLRRDFGAERPLPSSDSVSSAVEAIKTPAPASVPTAEEPLPTPPIKDSTPSPSPALALYSAQTMPCERQLPALPSPTFAASRKRRFTGGNLWSTLKTREPKTPLPEKAEHMEDGKPRRRSSSAEGEVGSKLRQAWEVSKSRLRIKARKGKNGPMEDWTVIEDDGTDKGATAEPTKRDDLPTIASPPEPSPPTLAPEHSSSFVPAPPLLSPSSSGAAASVAASPSSLSSSDQALPSSRRRRSSPTKMVRTKEPLGHVIGCMANAKLSVSPGVLFPPPQLLSRLRLQEIEEYGATTPSYNSPALIRQRSFAASDANALVIGFTADPLTLGNDPLSMPATPASTVSKATGRIAADARAGIGSLVTGNTSLLGQIRHQSLQYLTELKRIDAKAGEVSCRAPRWTAVAYYGERNWNGIEPDTRLADFIDDTVESKGVVCECGKPASEHVTCFVHNDVRVEVRVEEVEEMTSGEVSMWTSCSACDARSKPRTMSQATGLISFTKLLELLIYDRSLLPRAEEICDHASGDLLCAIRHFRSGNTVISLSLHHVVMYELRLPMPVTLSYDADNLDDPPTPPSERDAGEVEKIASSLRRFFASFSRRTDWLLEACGKGDLPKEKLAKGAKSRVQMLCAIKEEFATPELQLSLLKEIRLLGLTSLNNARDALCRRIIDMKQSLQAWEMAHLDRKTREQGKAHELELPPYMLPRVHAFPAGNSVLLREQEPSSFIAFALSSTTFRNEMVRLLGNDRARKVVGAGSRVSSPRNDSSSIFTSPSPTIPPTSGSGSPDRPESGAVTPRRSGFEDSVHAERGDEARTMRSKAGARSLGVGKQPSADTLGSRFWNNSLRLVSDPLGHLGLTASSLPEEVEAKVEGLPKRSDDAQLLESLLTSTAEVTPALTAATKSGSDAALPKLIADLVTPERRHASTVSIASGDVAQLPLTPTPSRSTAAADATAFLLDERPAYRPGHLPIFAEEDDEEREEVTETPERAGTMSTSESLTSITSDASTIAASEATDATVTSLTNTLTSLWPLGSLRQRPAVARSMSVRQMVSDADPTPHLRYEMKSGDLRISVIVWNAIRFSILRRTCGIKEADFVESMARCGVFDAAGGKSKAGFFKTHDDRYVLKTMTDAWSGSELSSMLDFADAYFRHFSEQSDVKPSLIAKLLGVYTITLKSGTEDVKLDLVVMENIFAAHRPTRCYDLKGIVGRSARATEKGAAAEVLWDRDWIESSGTVLVHAHSKRIITDAIANDVAFLARAGIQDYSALLGVSDEEHTLNLGVIDVLSTYTFAKALEHKAKMTLRPSTEVTVMPPQEYGERFRTSLNGYFLAAPEKWSAPPSGVHLPLSLSCPL